MTGFVNRSGCEQSTSEYFVSFRELNYLAILNCEVIINISIRKYS